MNKYIEAEKLKVFMWTMLTGNDLYTPNGIDEFVDRLPVEDVAEVVRCKNCKHADLFYPYCTIWEAAIDGNGYCYKGEKE